MAVLRPIVAIAVALLVAPAAPARADVLVVDASGGGDFVTLQAAVDAAASGDTILVRPPGITDETGAAGVNDKSLTIVGDRSSPTDPLVPIRSVSVWSLTAGQQLTLRGLRIQASQLSAAVLFASGEGALWIEDCELDAAHGTGVFGCFETAAPPGLDVWPTDASVTVVRSVLRGGKGADQGGFTSPPSRGGSGARIDHARVAFYECTLVGGTGGDGSLCGLVGEGGDGVECIASSTLLSGCTVSGGVGGSMGDIGTGLAGDAASEIRLLQTTVRGAPVFETAPGTVIEFLSSARSFAIDAPLREGQAGTLAMQGVQGDFVGFFWSFGSGALPMPARNGWFLLNPAQLGGPFFIGFIADPGGAWDIPITAPQLLPGLEAQTFLMQAWFQYPGGVTLGSGTALTVLDQAF